MSSTTHPTVFLLIRHAQTEWNAEERHSGSVEVALSEKAPRQIAKLTKKLSSEPISAIYSSPLTRCQITVTPLAHLLNLPVKIDSGLIERNLGSWEGKSPDELKPLHPGYVFPQSAYTGEFRIPEAETIELLEHRIRNALQTIYEENLGKTIAIATHSGVIWTILHRIVTNSPEHFFWPHNCSVTTIIHNGNHFEFLKFEEL